MIFLSFYCALQICAFALVAVAMAQQHEGYSYEKPKQQLCEPKVVQVPVEKIVPKVVYKDRPVPVPTPVEKVFFKNTNTISSLFFATSIFLIDFFLLCFFSSQVVEKVVERPVEKIRYEDRQVPVPTPVERVSIIFYTSLPHLIWKNAILIKTFRSIFRSSRKLYTKTVKFQSQHQVTHMNIDFK